MAIIYSYQRNTDILATDLVIGSSTKVVNGKKKNVTKNFEIGTIAEFYNEISAIAIAGQSNFFFQNQIAPGRKQGSISFVNGSGTGTPFSNITILRLSKFATSGNLIIDYINTLVNQAIIIAQCDDLNNFGIYKFNNILPVPGQPNFVDIVIESVDAHGSMLQDKFYAIAVYPGFVNPDIDPGTGDKNFVFVQAVASASWNVVHNLDKFPSVSIVDDDNNQVYGSVVYNTVNDLTITFTAPFSGKAYIN
jgi:hypothetical protein